MDDRTVQRILRDRIILCHGHKFDHEYRWDLESFSRVHDVDKKITVHGKIDMTLAPFILLKTTPSRNPY